MSKSWFLALALLSLLALSFWAPWQSDLSASQTAKRSFEAAWSGVIDGCGFSCEGCGVKQVEPAPFGRRVRLEYACGMLPADLPQYHQQVLAFVSFLGTVHGLPRP